MGTTSKIIGALATAIDKVSGTAISGLANIMGQTISLFSPSAYSLSFDGTDDYVDCGDGVSSISDYPFTVAGWFKATFNQGDGVIFSIADVGTAVTYQIRVNSASGEGGVRLTANDGSASSGPESAPTDGDEFNDGEWHHFA